MDTLERSVFTISVIKVTDYVDHVIELQRAHWQETESAAFPDGPKPAVELYRMLEQHDLLIAFGAFIDGYLIGYATAIVGLHMHYSFQYAFHDLLFVRPDLRKGTLGIRLMSLVEKAAKERGAKMIFWHAKPASVMEQLLIKRDYELQDYLFKKEL